MAISITTTSALNEVQGTAPSVTISVAADDELIVVLLVSDTACTPSAPTDTIGNSYSAAVSNAATNTHIFYAYNEGGPEASNVITFSSDFTWYDVVAVTLTGVHATSPIGNTNHNTGSDGTATTTGFSTSTDNSLILACFQGDVNRTFDTKGTGQVDLYTPVSANQGGIKWCAAATYETTTTAGSNEQSYVMNNSTNWDAAAVEILEATGGGGPTTYSGLHSIDSSFKATVTDKYYNVLSDLSTGSLVTLTESHEIDSHLKATATDKQHQIEALLEVTASSGTVTENFDSSWPAANWEDVQTTAFPSTHTRNASLNMIYPTTNQSDTLARRTDTWNDIQSSQITISGVAITGEIGYHTVAVLTTKPADASGWLFTVYNNNDLTDSNWHADLYYVNLGIWGSSFISGLDTGIAISDGTVVKLDYDGTFLTGTVNDNVICTYERSRTSSNSSGTPGFNLYRDDADQRTAVISQWVGTGLPSVAQTLTASYNIEADLAGSFTTTYSVDALLKGNHYTVSEDGRRVLDSSGNAVFFNGDTPWHILTRLSIAEQEGYYDARVASGVNAMIMSWMVTDGYPANATYQNVNGVTPFTSNSDWSTYNQAYFDHAVSGIRAATERGITVFLWPAYIGFPNTDEGWDTGKSTEPAYQFMSSQTDQAMYDWGVYVENQLKGIDNIIYVHGGDNDWSAPSGGIESRINSIVSGIVSVNPFRLHSYHGLRESNARDTVGDAGWLNLDASYGAWDSSAWWNRDAWQNSPPKPYMYIEGHYEDRPTNPTAQELRAQMYWGIFGGAFAQFYGHELIWDFQTTPTNWNTQLADPGASYLRIANNYTRGDYVPDWDGNILTGGQGSIGISTGGGQTYVMCAMTSNSGLIMAYTPDNDQLTFDLSQLNGSQAQVTWINPSDNSETSEGVVAASASSAFTPPSAGDWLFKAEVYTGAVTYSGVYNIDSSLSKTYSYSNFVDSLLLGTLSIEYSVNGNLQSTNSLEHIIDSSLKSTNSLEHIIDSSLKSTNSLEHIIDSSLKSTNSVEHVIDAVIGIIKSSSGSVTIRPDGDDVIDSLVYNKAGTTSNLYAEIDESTHDSDVTYVKTATFATTAIRDYTCTLQNPVSVDPSIDTDNSTITSIISYDYSRHQGDNVNTRRGHLVKIDGTEYASSSPALYTVTTSSWSQAYRDWNVNPATSSAWTWTEVNALIGGLRLRPDSSGATNVELQTTQLYYVVNYETTKFGYEQKLGYSVNSILSKTSALEHVIDSSLKSTDSLGHVIDGSLTSAVSLEHIIDSSLKSTASIEHVIDSSLKSTDSLGHLVDSSLKETLTKEHLVDTSTKSTNSLSYSILSDLELGYSSFRLYPVSDLTVNSVTDEGGSNNVWQSVSGLTSDSYYGRIFSVGSLVSGDITFSLSGLVIPNTSSYAIANVTANIRAAYVEDVGTVSSATVVPWIETSSTVYSGVSIDLTSTFTDYTYVWETNPNTGSAWTWDEVYNDLNGGYAGTINGTTFVTNRVSQINYTVNYYELLSKTSNHSIDTGLKKTDSLSYSTSANLLLRFTSSHSVDSYLSYTTTRTITDIVDTGGTGDYDDFYLWKLSITDGDLVAQNVIRRVICKNTDGQADTSFTGRTFSGLTTSADNYVSIESFAGHSGIWNDNVYRMQSSWTGNMVYFNVPHTKVTGIQFYNTNSTTGTCVRAASPSSSQVYFENCIFRGNGSSGQGLTTTGSFIEPRIQNCLAYGFTGSNGAGFKLGGSTTNNSYIYNSTSVNCQIGIDSDTVKIQAINCLTADVISGFVGVFEGSSDYNVNSALTVTPGANSISGLTPTFVDAGASNYHLSASDTVARDAGTDLSGASYPVTVDVIGTSRPQGSAFDIGYFEAIVSTQILTKAYNVDSVLRDTFSVQCSIDGTLSGKYTDFYSIDTSLLGTNSLSYFADSSLSKVNYLEHFVDSRLYSTKTSDYSIDSSTKGKNTLGYSIIGTLFTEATRTVEHSVESNLHGTSETVLSVDANLLSIESSNHRVDSILSISKTSNHSVNTSLKESNSKTYFVTSVLAGSSIQGHSVDTNTLGTAALLTAVDALLDRSGVSLYSVDSLLRGTSDVYASIDAFIVSRNDISHVIDALTYEAPKLELAIDAVLKGTTDVSHSVDARTTFYSDVVYSIDSTLRKGGIVKYHSTDSRLAVARSSSHSISASTFIQSVSVIVPNENLIIGMVPSTATNYECVDEYPVYDSTNVGTPVIGTNTTDSLYDVYGLTSVPVQHIYIHSIQIRARAKVVDGKNGSGGRIRAGFYINNTLYYSSYNNLTTSWVIYAFDEITTNPNTGKQWTEAEVVNLQLALNLEATNGPTGITNSSQASTVWVTVKWSYKPGFPDMRPLMVV